MAEKPKEDNFNSTANLAFHTGFQSTLSIASKDVVDDKQYNPFEHRQLEHPNSHFMYLNNKYQKPAQVQVGLVEIGFVGASTFGSILHLLKGCLGSGILAMPAAFKNSGLIAGSIGTFLAGLICTHTIHILVKTSQEVCIEAKKPLMGYAETCGAAFTYGPKKLRKYDKTIRTIVDYSMSLTYISVTCVYVVFIGSTFKEVLDKYTGDYQLSIQAYCALTLVPLVLISQIRNLKYLVPFSAIANILILIVFGITMFYMFTDLPSIKDSDRELVASPSKWPLFISTVIFAMEGIGVVMPVENEMRHPQRFLGCPGVLNVSMFVVIMLYGIFGFFGYLKWGDAVKGSVTLNLPQDSWVAETAQLLMALVIFFSYALQFYVPMEMVTRMLNKRQLGRYENIAQISIRTLLVSITVAAAAAIPNLELVIGLVGAVFLSTLGFLIPAIIETVYNWDRGLGPFKIMLWKNIVIGFISLFALFAGSYVAIAQLLEDMHDASKEVESLNNSTLESSF